MVRNPSAPLHLRRDPGTAVGAIGAGIWKRVVDTPHKLLPSEVARFVDMGYAEVVGGFFQMSNDSWGDLQAFEAYLQQTTRGLPPRRPRTRVVILVEFSPSFKLPEFGCASLPPHPITSADVPVSAARTDQQPLAETHLLPTQGQGAVYEWWFGERGLQSEMSGQGGATKPRGCWRRYHPRVGL